MTKIRVYETTLSGYDTFLHDDVSSLISHIAHILPAMAPNESYTITVVEMTQEEYDSIDD